MQDNQNEYIDHAWDEMRKLLDQELPVRRRRPLWWWIWAAAGLLGVILLSWYLWPASEGSDRNAFAKNKEREAVEAAVESPGQNVPEESSTPKSTGPLLDNASEQGSKTTRRRAIVQNMEKEENQKKKIKVISNQKNDNEALLRSELNERVAILRKPVGTVDRPPIVPMITLPNMTAKLLVQEVDPVVEARIPVSKQSAWSFGTEVALTTNRQAPLTGGFAGFTAARHWNRWSLHSGIGWGRQDVYVAKEDQVNESFSLDVALPGLNPEESSGPKLPEELTVRSSQLRMPISLAYRLAPRWRVGAGVDIRYWLRARQKWTYDIKIDPNAQSNARQDLMSLNGQQGDVLPNYAHRQWDAAPMLHVNYQPSHHWQFSLGGRFGIVDMSRLDNVTWHDRSLWLGVQRQF